MSFLALAQTILTFTAIVAVGALLRASGRVTAEDGRALHNVIIYVGLPAFVFKAVRGAVITRELIAMVGVAWVVYAVMLLLAWLAARALKLPPAIAGGFVIASVWGNTGFIGYPITEALFGADAVPPVVFSDVFGTVFSIVLVGLLVAEKYGSMKEGVKLNLLRELLSFPAVIALFVGLALRPFAIPELVSNGIDLLASMLAPLIMLSVGIALRPGSLVEHIRSLGALCGLRLLVAPALAVIVGGLVLSPGVLLRSAVLEASMPAMMLTLVIGARFDLDTDFIASAIFLSTALSAITIPLVQLLAF